MEKWEKREWEWREREQRRSNGERESVEEVGEEVGGVQWLRHGTAEMSPTSNSCEPNYIKRSS